MKTVDSHGAFEEILNGATEDLAAIARRLREIIVDVYPDVVEVPWPNQRIAGYGVGPKKMSEHYCYIAVQKERINLGFYYGAKLPDPDGLLEGPGANMRHVKVNSLETANKPEISILLISALKERKSALGYKN